MTQKIETKLNNIIFLAYAIRLSTCTGGSDSTKVVIGDACSLDNIIGATGSPSLFTAPTNYDIQFQVWVADADNGKVPKKVAVKLVNPKNQVQFIDAGVAEVKRADVAAALKSSSVEGARFSVNSKIQNVVTINMRFYWLASMVNK